MHLLTAHIDDLTAEASAPLDRLVDLSLQANRTSGLPKQLLMKKFDDMATYLTDQLDCVSKLFADRTRSLPSLKEPSLRSSDAAIEFLRKLTPHAIGAAKSLESRHDVKNFLVFTVFSYSSRCSRVSHVGALQPLAASVGN